MPEFFQLSQWTVSMLGAWNSLLNLLNKFDVLFTYINHTFFSHLSNAHPYPRLKDLKTYKYQKLGFWKGQQPKPCLILKTFKRNLGKELSIITYVTERAEVENQCPFPTGISFFKHHHRKLSLRNGTASGFFWPFVL